MKSDCSLPFELQASRRLIYFIILIFLVLMVFSFGIGYFIYIRKFTQLEEKALFSDELSINNILDTEIGYLGDICTDWAYWTDTWVFMQDGNEAYISSNLGLTTLSALSLNIMSLVHPDGSIKWQMEADLDEQSVRQSPEFPIEHFPVQFFTLESDTPEAGIALIDDRLMLIAYQSITRSDGSGGSVGTLFVGRDLSKSMLSRLNGIAQVDFRLLSLREIKETLTDAEFVCLNETGRVVRRKKGWLLSFVKTPVITDNDSLIAIELKLPRTVMALGRESFILYILVSLSGLLLMGYGTIRFLKRNYIQRVKELFQDIQRIKRDGDLSYRIPVHTSDEFGQFCSSFNSLLEVIEEQTFELTRKNMALHQQANTDELTGLYNKRYFTDWLNSDSFFNRSDNNPIAVLMVDIDHFKLYNDRYGHIAGDVCIRNVAELLRSVATRPTDSSIRYGGEEFLLILSNTDYHGAEWIARKVLKKVNDLDIENADSPIASHLTVSIGIACGKPADQESMMELISWADKALYKSKKGGRNRFSIWT